MKLCNEKYENTLYNDVFAEFPFELSDFQKYSIEAILRGNNALVTAPTGCGKTLPANFAINHFTKNKKKVIYTSPIKALSNEKMMTLAEKNPGVSFGLLTGDKKFNPDADVLVMTTEILTNTLFKMKSKENTVLDFDMDIEKDLGMVIFDEVHYINDKFRGGVWEMAIMMLPESVRILGLSATIDKAKEFCEWIETLRGETWLCPATTRIVPLEHNSLVFYPDSMIKKLKPQDHDTISSINGIPITMKSEVIAFDEKDYHERCKKMKILENKNVSETFVMNKAVEYLKNNDKLPAMCYVFSRKKTHDLASKITIPLFETGSSIPHTIAKECKQIIIKKIPNHKEFTNTKEYRNMVKLLEKGIAVHHSGVISIFREVIEILIGKGYIKLLFATESCAIGLNMPTRSILFPSLRKYDGKSFRLIKSHEYAQMAGRAGRRGIDTRGYIYHLMNIVNRDFQINAVEYRSLLSGKPETLKSKLKISFGLLLKLTAMEYNVNEFMEKSLLSVHSKKRLDELRSKKETMVKELETLAEPVNFAKKAELDKIIMQQEMKWSNVTIVRKGTLTDKEIKDYKNWLIKKDGLSILEDNIKNLDEIIMSSVTRSRQLLLDQEFINKVEDKLTLTTKGRLAFNLHEIHPLAMAEFMNSKQIESLTANQIASVLSIFTDVRISDDCKIFQVNMVHCSQSVKNAVNSIKFWYDKYYDLETKYQTEFIDDYTIHYDMMELIEKWTYAKDEVECKEILDEASYWGIYGGTFIKAVFKINNIAMELEKVYEENENLAMKEKMKGIQYLILKSIAVNQSLYI
jgi:superfamily II RNA helicase